MDVSFTNVLEGARQYFQGLPVPSTGAIPSEDHNHPTSSTNSTSSTSTSHDHVVGCSSSVAPPPAPPVPPPPPLPPSSSSSASTSSVVNQETTRYSSDVGQSSSTENGSTSSGPFWNPSMEPYPPQPTRVEVPDTRPGDESSEPSSSSPGTIVTLTEMQPSSHRSSTTSNFQQQNQSSVSSASTDQQQQHHSSHQQTTAATTSSSPRLHQLQPPQRDHSPEPVYQQLNNISRTSFATVEILATSHSTSHPNYQSANDRQPSSQSGTTIVAQRTQYYPRYHHPDITKSAPAPFSQNSVYQSANVGVTATGIVQQLATRPTPAEQNSVLVHGQDQQRVPNPSYGSSVQTPPSGGSTGAYVSSQNYRVSGQLQQTRSVNPTIDERIRPPQYGIEGTNAPSSSSSSSSSSNSNNSSTGNPCTSGNPPCNPRHGSSHIPPSPQNLPAHIPSPHLPSAASSVHEQHSQQQQQQQQQQQSQQHHPRINPSPHSANPNAYTARTILSQSGPSPSSSSSSSSNHPQQMIPPTGLSGYHPIASPHEPPRHATPSPHRQSPHVSTLHNPHASSPHPTPSPHAAFQPHSPTYPPPPPPARSTPHSYSVPASSQHYQNAGYNTSPYATPPQSSYHSFQKSPQQQLSQSHGNYYTPSNRSHNQSYVQSTPMAAPPQPICPGVTNNNSDLNYQQNKPVMYNGADTKRSPGEIAGNYASYRTSSTGVQRNNNTHNLPPIVALSSYHSNKKETGSKVQSIQRRVHSIGSTNKVPVVTPPSSVMVLPQRIPDYPSVPAPLNHTIPVNGRTTSSVNSTYAGRYPNQQNYPAYATTIAPSHHGSNSSSNTSVTSIGATVRSSVPAPPVHSYQSSDTTAHLGSYHHTVRTAETYPYKEQSYQNSTAPIIPAIPGTPLSAPLPPQTNGIRKRESPLDLSVKTVKTSADSTAQDDLETSSTDKHSSNFNLTSSSSSSSSSSLSSSSSTMSRSSSNGGARSMAPPAVQNLTPLMASYSNYDNRVSTRGIRSSSIPSVCPRTTTPQTVCAPKVDFLPDFNSTPLRQHHVQPHDSPIRRNMGQQQLYGPPPPPPPPPPQPTQPQAPLPSQYTNNTTPLPHMSTFQKSSLPVTPIYDGSPAPPPPSSSSYLPANDSSRSSSRYPPLAADPSKMGSTNLPPMGEHPSDHIKNYYDVRNNKFNSLMQKDHRSTIKRTAETVYPGTAPNKQPRLDTWRIAIDKQIEQKLSTVKSPHEQQQKRQEMNLPVAMPNGTLLSQFPYDQHQRLGNYFMSDRPLRFPAYCDKRNYPEQKMARTSPPYNHQQQPISKATNVHMLPQQVNSQTSYSNYRQNQRTVCPPISAMATPPVDQPSNTGADKRVLSLLRNSLENKQQREEQLNSQQPILANHNQQSFQNKVVAPVEPKTNIGRHNLSPFTAASLLERNSNTPPHYKFHVPRAVDSITQEAPRSMYGSRVNSSATLPGKEALLGPRGAENQIHRDKDDGLAAILAAKIRTKAELKQFLAKPVVVPSQDVSSTPKEFDSAASTSTPQSSSSAGSPPKLTREKAACLPPRRRLFSRTEEENMPVAATTVPVSTPTPAVASTVPPRASGFRSSSETSVFDFRESDSESEMPVLERQTLEEMRRDRKQLSKVQPPIPLNDAMCMNMASSIDLVKIELKENDKINEVDPFWAVTCDKFMEQLRAGDAVKKRGRKKKLDGGPSSKIEDTGNDSSKESDINTSDLTADLKIKIEDIKKEVQDVEALVIEKIESSDSNKDDEKKSITIDISPVNKEEKKVLVDSKENERRLSGEDSDEVPLIKRRTKKKLKKEDTDGEEEVICRKRRVRRGSRIKLASSSGSESSSEESDVSVEYGGHGSTVADRLRARKRSGNGGENEGMKLRSRDTTPQKNKTEKETKSSSSKAVASSRKSKPKPLFGDGSDFRPGWEEEVYVYKKSLRMPTRLITVSKPSRFHRLSTSLPDLDPGSPALSVSMDSSDVCLGRKRLVDSDIESEYSYSITGLVSKIDDEEATSSTTISCPPKTTTKSTSRLENNSIVDVLAQRVGTGKKDLKRKQHKDKLEKGTKKILQKGNNEPELLPTPSLTPLLASEAPKQPKGKSSSIIKSKSLKPIKVSDSFLLGYFRKETVNNFRDTFKNNHAIPNEFSTFVLNSRTRTETRVLKKQTTIREVFGEDRPASAPPMQIHGDTSQDDDSQNETIENTLRKPRTLKQKVESRLRNAGILRSRKAIVKSKRHLLKSIKKKEKEVEMEVEVEVEVEVAKETNDTQETENNEIEDENNESELPSNKKKLKLRTGRRKFRSGFDYVRKKKRPLKKDDAAPKERKRQILSKPSPECVADIQSEIRTWVIKKGVGETILHRAARLGHTDVTAYCLEKLNSAPSPKDNAGYTPLHEACSRGHLQIAKLLLAYGANVSESANGGIRPLHEAAESGSTELVRLLLSYGADPLLATYSGQTPLMLACETEAYTILEQHLDDIQGRSSTFWSFSGPASIFDPEETGYNPLSDPPLDSPKLELEEIEMEVSDINLPVLFSLANDSDKWVLLQDLMAALRIKSRDALLRQINPKAHTGPPTIAHRDVMRELKLPDFLERSRCCHLLSGGEKINVRGSKVTLIKYNEKVKSLLNVEKVLISLR